MKEKVERKNIGNIDNIGKTETQGKFWSADLEVTEWQNE